MLTITRTTSAVDFPITLDEAKRQLRIVDDSTQDAEIIDLIRTATEEAEMRTNRAFMHTNFQAQISNWNDLPISRNGYWYILPSPLIRIINVRYYFNNVLTTLAVGNYEVNNHHIPGLFRFTGSLPAVDNRPDAILINFESGYGSAGASVDEQRMAVPATIKHWIKMELATLDQMRQYTITGTMVSRMDEIGNNLLAPYILIQ